MSLPTVPELASVIDHAVLKPTQGERDVVDACTIARREHIASVCVKPFYVPDTVRLLKDSGVATSTVIGFPHGGQAPEVKVGTATNALRDGAIELDMVINIGALVDDAQKAIGAQIAVAADADFVKTSTGFGPEGATVEDVRLLREVVGDRSRVKAAGGIRTLDEALALLEAGADRLGTSSTKTILDELRERRGEG